MSGTIVSVLIHALKVKRVSEGTYQILLPAKEIDEEDHVRVSRLLPNLFHKFEELLAQETLLEAMVENGMDYLLELEEEKSKPFKKGKEKSTWKPIYPPEVVYPPPPDVPSDGQDE